MDLAAQTHQEWSLVLMSQWSTAMTLLALLLAGVAVALSWLQLARDRRPGARLLLGFLRMAAVSAVLLTVLQPAVRLRSVSRLPNTIAVLLDGSRSMMLSESPEKSARAARLRALLKNSKGRFAEWKKDRHLLFFSFGSKLSAPSSSPDVVFVADETRLMGALTQLKHALAGRDLAGVVVLSDGTDTTHWAGASQKDVAQLAKRVGAPIHGVWIGSSKVPDVSVTRVSSAGFAFVRNATAIEVEVTANGVKASRLPVRLLRDGRLLGEKSLSLPLVSGRQRVHFDFVPDKVGTWVFTVEVPVQPEETIVRNNRQTFVVQVIRDRVRVLQICGRPSWDERFLRRLLKRDPSVDLVSFFILRTPTSESLVPRDELSLIPFPSEELFRHELGSFDLIILQDFNFGPYGIRRYLPNIARYVRRGGGMVMIGGELSFSSGGYQSTHIEQILPVMLLPARWLRSRLVDEGEFRPVLTKAGREHPIFQLGATRQQTADLLKSLPALGGINRVAGVRSDATVLATHPNLRAEDGRPLPLVATREVDKGRTMVLATDTTWRWAFTAKQIGEGRKAYERFWRGAIRWLIRDPALQQLRLLAPRRPVSPRREVRIRLRAVHADYSPAANTEVRYELLSSVATQKGKPVKVTRKNGVVKTGVDGRATIVLDAQPTGAYRIFASANIDGRTVKAHGAFVVASTSRELRKPAATSALMRQLAESSGGQFIADGDEIPELSFRPSRVLRVNWHRDLELWNQWWWLLVTLVFLALEWAVRRRKGYA
jgi:uncharacterized membrane protein